MYSDFPYILPIVLAFSIAVMVIIYWVGGKISAKSTLKIGGKTAPYACGEELPAEELKVDLEKFLIFAVYFLIFDVLAFILATSFTVAGLVPAAYSFTVLMAVIMLLSSRRHR